MLLGIVSPAEVDTSVTCVIVVDVVDNVVVGLLIEADRDKKQKQKTRQPCR